jgi:hypothetical protein
MTAGHNPATAGKIRARQGQWLFRQGGLVLGPLLTDQIIERLYSGALDGNTEIAPIGQTHYRPLAQVDAFKVDLAKAQAKLRVDAIVQADRARRARKRNFRVVLVATAAAIAAVAAATGARYLAVHSPFKLEHLDEISVEPPTIGLAKARLEAEDLLDYPLSSGDSNRRRALARLQERSKRGQSTRTEPGAGEADADGLRTGAFDRTAINAIVASRQKMLYPCVADEAGKHPGLATKIPIEFVIGNDGRVSKVWVDHSLFKDSPLADCLLKELQKWPFRAYEGERATVGLSFRVGRGS